MAKEPRILRSDRSLVIGQTRSGKSVFARYNFDRARQQKIAIDVKREIVIPGAWYFSDPRDADWTQAVQVFRPKDPFGIDDYNAVYKQIFARRDIYIWLDECAGPTDSNVTPKYLRLVLVQGASKKLCHQAVSQRPVDIHKALRTETAHIVLFPRGFSMEDMTIMAKHMGMTVAALEQLCVQLLQHPEVYGKYPHLHYDKDQNTIFRRPSVPYTKQRPDDGQPD